MNILLEEDIEERNKMQKKQMCKKKKEIRYDIIIQVVMYIIVSCIWYFVFMRNIGFKSYLTNYPIPLTMVGGGFVSGFTICGGGAVSFPVFCKLLKLDPMMARDFALGIQSFGMTCASITIVIKKIPYEKRVAVFCTAGSFLGLLLGNLFIVPNISSENMKLIFSILVAAFGVSLILKNFATKVNKIVYDYLPEITVKSDIILFSIGIIGGLFTSVLGTGADIIAFSIVTILFKVSEKVLNPTSDIIMALSSIMGLAMRLLFFGGIHPDAAAGFPLAIPVVVVMAPVGAVVASKINRLLVVKFLLLFILVDIISTFYSLHMNIKTMIIAIIMFGMWLGFYFILMKVANKFEKRREKLNGEG